MLNVEQINLVFLKTYNTEFDEIVIRFGDQNERPVEEKTKLIWYCLLINENYMLFYRTRKDMDFCHSQEICQTNMEKTVGYCY